MHPSLTRIFYEHLEWQLSAALSRSPDRSRRRYWCDGILDPEWAEDYQPEYVRQSRQLRLRAWIDQGLNKGGGSGVQAVWSLTVKLGPQSFNAYLSGQELTPYVPAPDHAGWVLIDPDNQLLAIQLV